MNRTSGATALLGALVADAASMGLHWLYDVERIAKIVDERGGTGAFTPVRQANFDGVKGAFVHAARPEGGLTQYGEVLRLALGHVSGTGMDVRGHQAGYVAHFGPGGSYVGYIDRPTRGTLANLAAGQADPSGVDDDQLPALATLPAFVVAGATPEQIKAAIALTNVNPVAFAHGAVFADLLGAVLAGTPLADALRKAVERADHDIAGDLRAALDTDTVSSVDYGATTGRACHLPMAMPLIFHILSRSGSYAEAVETNIAAGGDSAGRAIPLGAVMGAVHGLEGKGGIPLDWVLRLQERQSIWEACRRVAQV